MDTASPRTRDIGVWNVVRVDYPFADEARIRRRPALVIAVPAVRQDFAVLWVMMITSAQTGRWPLDVPISNLALGGLDHSCVVRTSKITAMDARLAVPIGELSEADRVGVRTSLRVALKDALPE